MYPNGTDLTFIISQIQPQSMEYGVDKFAYLRPWIVIYRGINQDWSNNVHFELERLVRP